MDVERREEWGIKEEEIEECKEMMTRVTRIRETKCETGKKKKRGANVLIMIL